MALHRHKQNWEDLAEMDAYWAILTDPAARYGRWDVDEFFRTGQRDSEQVMAEANRLGLPADRKSVLDFGCGVGRLTRAFAQHFEECWGVDISQSMITQANRLNQVYPTCHFVVNDRPDLGLFPDNHFDMVYTLVVLQHISNSDTIKSYLSEFVRILKPGGLLAFQLPYYIAPKDMRQARSKLYAILRSAGVSRQFLYQRLRLHPIRMNFIPKDEVLGVLERAQGRVVEIREDASALPALSKAYFVTK